LGQGWKQCDTPIALADLYRVWMVDAAGVVDRRIVVLAHNHPSLIDRAVVVQQVDCVGDHAGSLPACF